jgi:hypothetical integral membrane protein (TIGR02206 family)
MNSNPGFQVFGPVHVAVICLTIAIPVLLGVAVRLTGSRRLDLGVALVLSSLLATNYLGFAVYLWQHNLVLWKQALPFQLCDWALVAVIVALLTGWRGWAEVSYFWGIGGTWQAILTPNLQVNFPDIRAISFFIMHGGIVAGVIYLLIARRIRITAGAVWRTLAWSELYLVATLVVDQLTGVNYGFLLQRPAVHSILDYLSDERWLYVLELNGLALLFFELIYAPWGIAELVRRNRAPRGGDRADFA